MHFGSARVVIARGVDYNQNKRSSIVFTFKIEIKMDQLDNHDDLALEEALNVHDLLNGGTKFTLQSNFQKTDDDDDLFAEENNGEEGILLSPEDIISPWEQSFAELIPSMTNIGNKIYKKIIKQPIDNVEIEGRCRVTVTYSSYWEKKTDAFDSTFLRGEPMTFVTNNGQVLKGLDLAVQSMKRGEESHFIIPYDLLFGKQGCEPRIRKEADGLYVIQLLKFSQIGDDEAMEQVSEEDRKKYHVMIDKIIQVKQSGIDNFKQGSWIKAAGAFHRAILRLEMCQMRNEAEEKEQQELLIKLYINMMTCHNKMDKPKQVCSAFKELSRLTNTSQNAKALYAHGKALMSLGEFQRAKEALTKSYRLKPNDDVSEQLRILDQKHSAHKTQELNLWRKAMGNAEPYVPQHPSEVTDKFKATIKEIVENFENNTQGTRVDLPQFLTQSEISAIKDFIKDRPVKFVTPIHGKNNHQLARK